MSDSRNGRIRTRTSSLPGPTVTTVPPAVDSPYRARLPKLRQACTLLACIALFHACGGDDTTEPPLPDPPRPTTVAVSPGTAQLSALGATVQLTAEVRDQTGQAMAGAAVAWSSGSDTVATVDGSGLVTAGRNGTVTITATAGSATGSAAVTVAQVASAVAVTPETVELTALGATVQLSTVVLDENGHELVGAGVAWSNADPSVATVDDAGLVTAVANGTTTVTATSGSASGSAAVTVSQVASRVAVTPATVELTALGATVQLSAEVLDEQGNALEGAAVAWSNADPSVVTVDTAGLVTAVSNGMATVTATSGSASGSAAVTVLQVASAVAVTPATVELTALGATAHLSAEVLDENGHELEGAAVAWSNADPSVATVDGAGLVTAVANGMTTVTATSDSASGSAAVTVTQVASVVTVEPTADTLSPGDTLRLSARAEDANGHLIAGAEFSWTSSNNAVAPVDNSGLVTAVGLGVATITAQSGDASTVSEIMVVYPDRAALVALYQATDGPNWARNEGWLSNAPLGLWHGVDTDSTGRVTRLAIVANRLSGALPPELGDLANLMVLTMTGNALSGPIPHELGNLANLEVLNLGDNELSGPIPPELGNLVDLETLWLWGNDLSGPNPTSFRQLRRLENFIWHDTDLCIPTDRALRWWLRSIRSQRGTEAVRNCPSSSADSLRLDFNSLAEVADWTRSSSTDRAVRNGILRVGTNQPGGNGFIWKAPFLASVVTDWEARVRLGRGQASGSAQFRVVMDHPQYTRYGFEFGSGKQLGGVDTNWRVLFYDRDFHGPGRGSWVFFGGYGYGMSSAIKDGAGEFMDVTIESKGDSLRIHVDGTLLFADRLPLQVRQTLAVDVRGVVLGYDSHTLSSRGHANFDWVELKGQVISSGSADASVEAMHRTMDDAVSIPRPSIRPVKVPP